LKESEEKSNIRLSQAGDKDAFRMLIEQHERMVFGIAYSMTYNRDSAADAVQEALLKAWKNLPSLREENAFRAWLVRIVINEVKQQGRRNREKATFIEKTPDLSDTSDGIETEIERNDIHKAVRRAIQRLPSKQRQAIVLRYFGELTMTEIAFVMGCRKGTVKSRLSRALEHLRDILSVDEMTDERGCRKRNGQT
jgi:RNA polymerase sigma-70 factor (ECF subfamily)